MFPSPSVRVRLRERLLELAIHAVVADGGRATRLLAELADVDLSIAAFALFLGGGRLAHDFFSIAAITSFCKSRPNNLPSDVVIGEFSTLWSAMKCSISWADTNGRNVLGPGRIAFSMSSSGLEPSSFERSSPSTTRSSLTTTAASQPAALTRVFTSPTFSVRPHV